MYTDSNDSHFRPMGRFTLHHASPDVIHLPAYRGGRTRGAEGALARPFFQSGGAKPYHFSEASRVKSLVRIEREERFLKRNF